MVYIKWRVAVFSFFLALSACQTWNTRGDLNNLYRVPGKAVGDEAYQDILKKTPISSEPIASAASARGALPPQRRTSYQWEFKVLRVKR
jgi:hypothetical protein